MQTSNAIAQIITTIGMNAVPDPTMIFAEAIVFRANTVTANMSSMTGAVTA